MNINILRYSLFGIAGGQEVDHVFVKFIIHPLTMIALGNEITNFVMKETSLGQIANEPTYSTFFFF